MTINWRYTVEENLGILSVAGYLGPDAVHRFIGAVGWALARGTGPVIVDLTELRSWSAEGQVVIAEAARRLTEAGRSLELAAIPADGSLVPTGDVYESGATVFVDGARCMPLQHDLVAPHERLTCTLPAGSGAIDRPR